ncbi:MAG TPA: hypothetical protein VHE13_09060 [Opitutus sp.]|nr:hypothetical protein [Opitutus sp.]
MKSRIKLAALVVLALAATGAAMRWIAPPPGRTNAPGGLRTVAADFAWLRTNVEWERRDAARTRLWLNVVVALDPRPLYFWVNGARMMAYDFPAWQRADGGAPAGTREALEFLRRAMAVHPDSAALWIERANVELNGTHDLAAAAASYRHASELPGAPYFCARLHAELLRRLGRKTEALAWLARLHPRLPPDDEAAEANVVLARIRELERELGVPAAHAYRPPHPGATDR